MSDYNKIITTLEEHDKEQHRISVDFTGCNFFSGQDFSNKKKI